jgi:hypothetical protein
LWKRNRYRSTRRRVPWRWSRVVEEEHAMAMEEEEHAMASRLQEWLLHVERELQEREREYPQKGQMCSKTGFFELLQEEERGSL